MIYIANWKSYLSFNQEIDFVKEHQEFIQNNNIIISPSFLSINAIAKINSKIKIAAQNCSEFENGAYTGLVSAKSLSEAGAKYCIVGHSEVRKKGDNQNIIKEKVKLLIQNNLVPIICIGETLQEYESNKRESVIKEQLEDLLIEVKDEKFIIAYEPAWSIGTGKIPTEDDIKKVIDLINNILDDHYIQKDKSFILYGGSVSSQNVKTLKRVDGLKGFLIGKASTDFQELKKIVELN